MGSDTRPPSLVLPGAWSSAWTLPTLDSDALNTSEGLNLSSSPLLPEELFYLDHSSQPAPQHGRRVSKASSSDHISACDSDEESTKSDDFYSIISQEDADIAISPKKETAEPEDELDSIHSTEHETHPTRPCLKLNAPLHAGVAVSHDVPSEASASCSVHMPAEHPHLASDMSNVSSSSSVQAKSSSSASARGASPSSRRSSSSCSSRSVAFRKNVPDHYSLHSSYSGSGYAHLDKDYDISSESMPYSHNPSSSTGPRSIRRKRINGVNHSNSFNLPQPDSDDPWTLSLEPALTSTESTTSRSSVSLSSEPSNTSPPNGEILERYLTSITSSSLLNPIPHDSPTNSHQGISPYSIHTDTATQRADNAIYSSLPQEEVLFSHIAPEYAYYTPGERKSKNVIKKTKVLYSKFKQFMASRGSKQTDSLPIEKQNTSVPTHSPDIVDEDTAMPTPVKNTFSPSSSRTSWSFPRRGFRRSAKISTPSIARSSTTEVAHNHPSASMDGMHPYGYQATSRTSKEIRSKRHFSLPTFAGPSSGSNTSMPQKFGTFSRPLRRQQAGSIISAR